MPRETRSGPKHDNQGTELKATCAECGRITNHLVIHSAEYTTEYQDGNFSVTAWEDHQLVECRGCQAISYRRATSNSENVGFDPETGNDVLFEKVELFPQRLAGRKELGDAYLLPYSIQRVYEETVQALRAGMPVLAGIGLRALVETICKDHKAKGRNLEKKIDNLVTLGVITAAGADILHSLRVMGNDAAHEVKPHSLDHLNTALDVIEHALVGIYLLPKRAAKLPNRKRPSERSNQGSGDGDT